MHKYGSIKGKIQISSYDDLLGVTTPKDKKEVTDIPLTNLHTFKDHPFHVVDDEKMQELVESIREKGVLSPAIVRKREAGGYEIISGHRRKRACEIAGLHTMPVLIRDLDDDEATILMVDANIQRENILPSERAFSLQMKMKALRNQGKRTDLTSGQVDQKFASEEAGKEIGISPRQVRRYVSLTNLIPELLEMVDAGKIGFVPAVNISGINRNLQKWILKILKETNQNLTLRQSELLKQMYDEKSLLEEDIVEILVGKKATPRNIVISETELNKYFPQKMDSKQIKKLIIDLIKKWKEESQDG